MLKMSTSTHGVIDYVAGAAFIALPRLLDLGQPAGALLQAAGGGAFIYSALTNYERGVLRVIPMKGHLALDALSGGALLGAAMVLKDEAPRDRAVLAGVGLFEIVAALMTETSSANEQTAERPAAPRVNAADADLFETGVPT